MTQPTTVPDKDIPVKAFTMDHQVMTRPEPIVFQPFPFMKLPAELRLKVLDHFFANRRLGVKCQDPECTVDGCIFDEELYDDCDFSSYTLRITQVSKTMRAESTISFLRTVIFDFLLLEDHLTWTPSAPLKSYIKQAKHLYGPPRMLHFLNFTTLQGSFVDGAGEKWVDECAAEHVVCDMTFDLFDIQDAMGKEESNEAKLFADVKNAVKGPKGDRLTLCVRVEDAGRTWDGPEDPYYTGIQVWKKKVIVRIRPATEEGKVNLKNVLDLLGLELKEKDKKCIEPVKDDEPADDAGDDESVGTDHPPDLLANTPDVPDDVEQVNKDGGEAGDGDRDEDRLARQWWSG